MDIVDKISMYLNEATAPSSYKPIIDFVVKFYTDGVAHWAEGVEDFTEHSKELKLEAKQDKAVASMQQTLDKFFGMFDTLVEKPVSIEYTYDKSDWALGPYILLSHQDNDLDLLKKANRAAGSKFLSEDEHGQLKIFFDLSSIKSGLPWDLETV